MMPIRRLTCALLTVVCVLGLAACGEKQESTGPAKPESVRVMLDFFPNADHAGLYAAQGTGAFRRAGLNVSMQTPSDPSAPLKLLAAGKVDLAISYEPELLLARDRGQKLVAVGALVQKPLTSIVSIGRKAVATPQQLAGKTVGTAGIPYQSAYLKAILAKAGVAPSSVKEVNVGFNLVPAMLSGKVDATLGAYWNYEAIQLAQKRKHPKVIRMETAGVPTYDELVIVARQDALDEKGGAKVRRFLRALAQGMKALKQNPDSGIAPLMRANPDLDRRLRRPASRRRCRCSSRPTRRSRSATWTRPSGLPTGTGWRPTGSSGPRRRRPAP